MPLEFGEILFELKRRNVFKVGVLYVVVSWLLYQVAGLVVPAVGGPAWGVPIVMILLALGFPFAIIFAWTWEITPAGIRRAKDVPIEQSITRRTGRMLDIVVVCFLIVAVSVLALDVYVLNREVVEVKVFVPAPEKSVAVLPFANLSDDPENEYFSDGLAEELLNVLARVQDLKVRPRTSSFQFKDTELSLGDIGQALNVRNVVEGSVRKWSNKVRVTAELIDVESDRHLWAETYERELSDIFAIQDEITNSIVQALKIALHAEETQAIAKSQRQTANLEAFEMYLQAKHLWRQRNAPALKESIEKLERVITVDPNFGQAYAVLSMAYYVLPGYAAEVERQGAFDRAEQYANMALSLDPASSNSHAVLASIAESRLDWNGAKQSYEAALRLQSGEATPHHWYAIFLLRCGQKQEALAEILKAYDLDPNNGSIAGFTALIYLINGEPHRALEYAKRSREIGYQYAPVTERIAYLDLGEYEKSSEAYAEWLEANGADTDYADAVTSALVGGVLPGMQPPLPEGIEDRMDILGPYLLEDRILLGDYDGANEILAAFDPLNRAGALDRLWSEGLTGFRKTDAFKDYVEGLGLVAYWRQHGWPAQCRPMGDSFECE